MKLVPLSIQQKVSNKIAVSKADSPNVYFALGIVGVVASTVLACRATLKLSDTLDDIRDEIDEVKSFDEAINNEDYTKSEHNKQVALAYAKGTYRIVKLYAPSLIVGSASIAALANSHNTLTNRNKSLIAAYTALQTSYDSYRERVKKEIGEEKELDIYQSARIEKVTINGETKNLRLVDPNKHSPYARFFDEASPNWVKNPELNRLFVQCQQNWMNHLLHARGHVFLNEVYDALGIDRSSAGQVVGWVVGSEGDNYIDFGIFETHNSAFVNGWERSILLDFNVDGVIINKI